jgi:cob(I)alamin adenosyltransferase
MMHVYYGDGKGKTTAALGLALRAAGHGKKVVIVQFLKNSPTGEEASFKHLPDITLLRGKAGKAFTFTMDEVEKQETRLIHNSNLERALSLVYAGACDMLILDEGMDAVRKGLVDEALIRRLVFERPENLELVVTGHKPVQWLLDAAGYVTEMIKKKHPFDRGVAAREGIEF